MTYAYVQDSAASWDPYERTTTGRYDPLPTGLLVHVVGPVDDGARVIDVWESEEAWARFRAERLAPAIAALGESCPPEATFRDVRAEIVVVGSRAASPSRGREEEEG